MAPLIDIDGGLMQWEELSPQLRLEPEYMTPETTRFHRAAWGTKFVPHVIIPASLGVYVCTLPVSVRAVPRVEE
jgi:hypothetical protein